MIILFENRYGERRQIGQSENWADAISVIHKFLKENQYVAPYWRYIQNDTEIMIDVGSHSEFFYVIVPENFCLTKEIG